MARFIVTGCYTAAAMKGMIASPSDREVATRALVEAAGGKLSTYLLTTGDSDFLMVIETDDVRKILPALLVAGASGSVTGFRTSVAFTAQEFMAAQQAAGGLAQRYAPPAR
jgi:uncharacterized protein with GYD domain